MESNIGRSWLAPLARAWRDESGQILVMTMTMMLVFITLIGTAVDYGAVYAESTGCRTRRTRRAWPECRR